MTSLAVEEGYGLSLGQRVTDLAALPHRPGAALSPAASPTAKTEELDIVAVGSGGARPRLEQVEKLLGSHKIATTTWSWSGEGSQRDLDEAVASRIGRWIDHE